MCYDRASTLQNYYQLVYECVPQIRDDCNGEVSTDQNPGFISSAGQNVNTGKQNMPTSQEGAAQNSRRTHFRVNQAGRANADHASHSVTLANSINGSYCPNSGSYAIPVNSINPVINPINMPSLELNSISQQSNHLPAPATIESYMISPALTQSQPRPSDNSVHQFAIPTLKHMNCTSAPSVTGPPINSTLNEVRRHVFATTKSLSSPPRNEARFPAGPLSRAGQPVSTTSAGLNSSAPRENAIQKQRSRKRKPAINKRQEDSSVVKTLRYQQPVPRCVFNSVRAGSAAPAYQKDSMQGIAPTQRKPHVPSSQSRNPDGQLSTSPSMNQRIIISDDIDVSVGEAYNAAASCGYKFTAEQIKGLPKEQILRFLVCARQKVLKTACNLPREENGQINDSQQQLGTLDLDHVTTEPARGQAATGTATVHCFPSSSPQIVQRDSIPPNMEMNATNMVPINRNLHPTSQANGGSQNKTKIAPCSSVQERRKHQDSREVGVPHVTMRETNSAISPSNQVQGNEKTRAYQSKTFGQAPVASSKEMRANTEFGTTITPCTSHTLPVATTSGVENVVTIAGTPFSRHSSTDTETLPNCTATISSRVTRLQTKYAVYKDLINQTLQFLVRMGHEGQMKVLYLRYSMHLLTEPAALGPQLTLDVLNTIENFLRLFLGYQGIRMKSETKKSYQTDALRQGGSLSIKSKSKEQSSNAQITAISEAQIAVNADSAGKDEGIMQNTRSETDPQAICIAETHESDSVFKPEDAKELQKEASALPSAQAAPAKPAPGGGIQALTPTPATINDVHSYSAIGQKFNRVYHSVHAALHETEKCEKYLEKESMLSLKRERISEIFDMFRDDNKKQPRESKRTANAELLTETSLLEIINAECDSACKKHKKLLINIVQKWNKPVVECLLAYQCIRLPKIVINVGGSYRKDLSASVGFERPPFGWVSVLTEIKKRFTTLMATRGGVNAILQAWAAAAGDVLGDEDIQKK